MNDLISMMLSMSSREIAELTKKRHAHVLRDIETMLKELYPNLNPKMDSVDIVGVSYSQYGVNNAGKPVCEYHLDKEHTLTLVTGYNVKLRHAVIKRWYELEYGKSNNTELTEWEEMRMISKSQRNYFTRVIQKQGVEGRGYAMCTNAMYRPLYGGTAKELKERRGLKKSQNLRDHMTAKEIGAIFLTETQSAENIENKNLRGNFNCAKECNSVATQIAAVINPKLPNGQKAITVQ